jgi:hypothetical protein
MIAPKRKMAITKKIETTKKTTIRENMTRKVTKNNDNNSKDKRDKACNTNSKNCKNKDDGKVI